MQTLKIISYFKFYQCLQPFTKPLAFRLTNTNKDEWEMQSELTSA